MKLAPLGLIFLGLVAHFSHRWLDTTELPEPTTLEETLPSLEALRLLSLGYKSLVADYYWLRAINEFGTTEKHRFNYPNLAALTTRVLDLDPYYATAYYFAGTAMTLKGMDIEPSNRLLRQGMAKRPELWRIPFLLGFNLFYFQQRYAEAAEVLAHAATLSDAPEFVGPLATRLAAEAGQPELGLQLVGSILPTIADPKLRAVYEERQKLLELELALKWLGQAEARFEEKFGRKPTHIDELVGPGLMRSLPDEPLGGRFYIEAGEVKSTSDAKRLRLSDEAKGLKSP